MKPKILLLSGYDAVSHQQWRNRLAENLSEFEWTQLALPPRHFSWRTRGSSLSFAFNFKDALKQHFDLIIATSMVDLASLRGFSPKLATVPTIVYFHENQFVYPISNAQPNIVNAQLTSIYCALCADFVVFNSAYNQKTFCSGAKALMDRLPDEVPSGLIDSISQKSQILAVPIENDSPALKAKQTAGQNRVLKIVWNHRWEYDKQPSIFFEAITRLRDHKVLLELHVLGQSFRKVPDCFAKAKQKFADQIVSWGYQPLKQYQAILQDADIVVSTALHDFQGLSMLQAIAAGCVPIAPNRVAYAEYIPESLLYPAGKSAHEEAINLSDYLYRLYLNGLPQPPDVSEYTLSNILPKYREMILSALNLSQ